MTDIARLKPSPCLHCGSINDAATGVATTNTAPSPGDIAVCLNCGHIAAYNDDLGIRELTVAEQIELAGDRLILAVQRARRALEQKP